MFIKQVYYCRATDVKALTQAGTGIRFYYAISDPTRFQTLRSALTRLLFHFHCRPKTQF